MGSGATRFLLASEASSRPAPPAASPPGAPGDAYLANNGFTINRFGGGTWANTWGPLYPFTFPPLITSGVSTTINHGGGYTSGDTSLVVASGAVFPAAPFLVSIGSEDLKVTVNSSNTLTVTRGYNGTSAASISDGATVTLVNWEWVDKAPGLIRRHSRRRPIRAFTWTADSTSATVNLRIQKRLIANTSSGDLQAAMMPLLGGTNLGQAGIIMRESGTGKLAVFTLYNETASTASRSVFYIQSYASPTSFTASQVSSAYFWGPPVVFMRMTISGSNILFKTGSTGNIGFRSGQLPRPRHLRRPRMSGESSALLTRSPRLPEPCCTRSRRVEMEAESIAPVKPKRGRPPKARVVVEHPAYQDPIAVELTMRDGKRESFRCAAYESSGPVWRFKSFPPERGRQIVRLISASEVASCRIDEPEKVEAPVMVPSVFSLPTNVAPPGGYQAGYGNLGPTTYVAKDHLANRAEGGLVNGTPQSIAKDEHGNVTRLGAAMLPPGAVS